MKSKQIRDVSLCVIMNRSHLLLSALFGTLVLNREVFPGLEALVGSRIRYIQNSVVRYKSLD